MHFSRLITPRRGTDTKAQPALLIQPWICAPGTYHCWVDRGSMDSKFTQGFEHMTGAAGIETPDLRISSSMLSAIGHTLHNTDKFQQNHINLFVIHVGLTLHSMHTS